MNMQSDCADEALAGISADRPYDGIAGVMIDIETLGTGPDAVVLEVSVVPFTKTFQPLEATTLRFDVQDQIDRYGRTVSYDTMRWWANQPSSVVNAVVWSDENRMKAGQGMHELQQLLTALGSAYRTQSSDNGAKLPLYSLGSFDFEVLSSLYRSTHGVSKQLFHYRQPHDLRTLRSFLVNNNPVLKAEVDALYKAESGRHSSAVDCLLQLDMLRLIWEHTHGSKQGTCETVEKGSTAAE